MLLYLAHSLADEPLTVKGAVTPLLKRHLKLCVLVEAVLQGFGQAREDYFARVSAEYEDINSQYATDGLDIEQAHRLILVILDDFLHNGAIEGLFEVMLIKKRDFQI